MRSLTQAETQKLLDAIDPREDLFGVRDRAMLELALHTGLRVSELVGLSIKDVSSNGLARETLHVPASLAKYSRGRMLPLNSTARRAIHTILYFNKSHGFSVAAEAVTASGGQIPSAYLGALRAAPGAALAQQGRHRYPSLSPLISPCLHISGGRENRRQRADPQGAPGASPL